MIVDLPDTTTSEVSKTLVKIREEGGAVALGRVLTLIIATSRGHEEEAIDAANDASREHPIIRSLEPGEDWCWCFEDQIGMRIPQVTGTTRIPPSPMLSR